MPFTLSRTLEIILRPCNWSNDGVTQTSDPMHYQNTAIPRIAHILVPGKNTLSENRVSGTVLIIQLTRNSPTCVYIGQNPHKWKPR